MGGFARCTYGDYGSRIRNLTGDGEHGGTAEAVTDEQLGSTEPRSNGVGGAHQIRHIGREIGVCELSFTVPEAGKIESQHGDPLTCQGAGNPRCRGDVLGAGEAVGEQGIGGDDALRPLQQTGQLLASGVLKLESFLIHSRNCDLVHL